MPESLQVFPLDEDTKSQLKVICGLLKTHSQWSGGGEKMDITKLNTDEEEHKIALNKLKESVKAIVLREYGIVL